MTAATLRQHVFGLRTRGIYAIWLRHATVFASVWRIAVTWILVEPLFVLVGMALGVGRLVDEVQPGVEYAVFVAPGVIMGNAMFHAIFVTSWDLYHRVSYGQCETAMTAPVTITEIALGEMAWAVTRALLTTVSVGVVAAVMGLLDSPWAVGMIVAAVLVGLEFGALGMIFAALSPNTHVLSLVFTVVATPLFFFSGGFFPIENLPGWLQPVAWAQPLTPAVHLARGFSTGDFAWSHLWSALYMIGFTCAVFPVSAALLKRRLVK
jgi:lipooligosaccharide transport system permease protein